MGYKVTIVLIWLALPLAGLLLLRADYERYQSELKSQLKYAQAEKDLLVRYSDLYDNREREVPGITDPQTRILWEQHMRELDEQLETEQNNLGNASLNHYPQAEQLLKQAQTALQNQRDQVRDAGRLQDAYAKSEGNLDDLREQAMSFYVRADQARMFGWWQQYVVLQDALARVEAEIERRDSYRYQLSNDLNLAINEANLHRAELRQLLSTLPDQIALDQGRTYREDLAQRFHNFSLRNKLREVATGIQTAQAAQAQVR